MCSRLRHLEPVSVRGPLVPAVVYIIPAFRGMPPYKGRLTDEQIRDVAAYVAQAAGA